MGKKIRVWDGSAWQDVSVALPYNAVHSAQASMPSTAVDGQIWLDTDGTLSDTQYIPKTLTSTTGDIIYASSANTPARLGIGTSGQLLGISGGVPAWTTPTTPNFVGCSIYNSTSFSISNNTATRITCNSEFFDTHGFHDTSTNTARITIPAGYAGKYLVSMGFRYEANASGDRTVSIYKNNASFVELAGDTGGSGGPQYPRGSVIINLAAGDYIEMYTQQTSGSTLTGYAREYEHPIQVQWLGA